MIPIVIDINNLLIIIIALRICHDICFEVLWRQALDFP